MIYKLFLAITAGAAFCATPGAAETSSQTQRQQLDVQRTIAANVGRIAKTSVEHDARARQPDPLNAPCPPGTDSRTSDLCAQWKAADAAASAAWWAWASGLVSALSLLGVVAALLLTVDSNRIARSTARQQLRAYMGVTSCSIQILDDRTGFILQAELHNAGQTPAYAAKIFGEAFAASYPLDTEREFLPVQSDYATPIMPGHTLSCAYRIFSPHPLETVDHVKAGEVALYIQGICKYLDVFGEEQETKFRYVFGGRIANAGGLVLHAAATGNSAT